MIGWSNRARITGPTPTASLSPPLHLPPQPFLSFLSFSPSYLHPPPHTITSLQLSLSPHLFLPSLQAPGRGTERRRQVSATALGGGGACSYSPRCGPGRKRQEATTALGAAAQVWAPRWHLLLVAATTFTWWPLRGSDEGSEHGEDHSGSAGERSGGR